MRAAERALVEHLAAVEETRRVPCGAAVQSGEGCPERATVALLLDTLNLHRVCKVHGRDLLRTLGLLGQHAHRVTWWDLPNG